MESLNGRRLVVSALRRTCPGCPNVWEGPLENDEQLAYLYVRYRDGYLSCGVGADEESAQDDAFDNSLFADRVGDPHDGFLEMPRLKSLLDAFFIWPQEN